MLESEQNERGGKAGKSIAFRSCGRLSHLKNWVTCWPCLMKILGCQTCTSSM